MKDSIVGCLTVVKAMEEGSKKSTEKPAIISSSTLHIQREERVSCWMDIVSGDNPNNRPVDTYLHIGQEATLVVKVHQPGIRFKSIMLLLTEPRFTDFSIHFSISS